MKKISERQAKFILKASALLLALIVMFIFLVIIARGEDEFQDRALHRRELVQ